jgi:beta-lactamase superfamily II metal-dependent hydrolase
MNRLPRLPRPLLLVATTLLAISASAVADDAARRLDIYWIDVEGGAATLIVTPAGESVLIDAGSPGGGEPGQPGRDAGRILKVARDVAGLKQIDSLVVTHFHLDHFGGVAELSRGIPVGTLYENPLEEVSEQERAQPALSDYLQASVKRRRTIEPGLEIPLAGKIGSAYPKLQFVGTRRKFVPLGPVRANQEACAGATRKADDPSDNAMSAVLLLRFGGFRFFAGGDITWNVEETLACPQDLVGSVDVYQSTHHGLDQSNNPVLLKTLEPSVVVFTNGARKGLGSVTVAAVRSLPSLKAVFQLHRGLAEAAANAEPGHIANAFEACAGAYIKLSVHPEGKSYVVTLPSTTLKKSFDVRKH